MARDSIYIISFLLLSLVRITLHKVEIDITTSLNDRGLHAIAHPSPSFHLMHSLYTWDEKCDCKVQAFNLKFDSYRRAASGCRHSLIGCTWAPQDGGIA